MTNWNLKMGASHLLFHNRFLRNDKLEYDDCGASFIVLIRFFNTKKESPINKKLIFILLKAKHYDRIHRRHLHFLRLYTHQQE